ncbi:patatin-like phospholipase family protein [Kordia jejudonensis]|uniref:patatin-like phospholipase family protein n=1 Tax=Kordia jejudonensis TaxID=1348245 RepID=UPI0006292970|nr:patatin-like phospholipase family protein [Kordia jejudonensis]
MQLKNTHQRTYFQLCIILVFSLVLCTSCRTKATVLAWSSAETPQEFPEAKLNLPKTGVCFSGGGTRAMNCAIGQMKGLEEIGLWDDVGYISAVSGGSWASTIFTYYQDGAANDKELLGTIMPPNEITLKNLQQMPKGFMGEVITKNLMDDLFERLGADLITHEILQKMDFIWIDGIGHTYLKPFGLYDPENPKYFTLNTTTRDDILARNNKLNASDFIMVHSQEGDIKRPFLVVNSSVVGPNKDLPIRNPENLSVFNYTPLYVGSNHPLTVSDKELIFGRNIQFTTGGGFVEPFGFGSDLLSSQSRQLVKNEATPLRVKLAERRFEAVDATGTSSAAYGAIVSSNIFLQLSSDILLGYSLDHLLPEEEYWPISKSGVVENAEKYRFSDGGNLENYGLITLLQRGVEKVVVFINTDTPITINLDPSENCPPLASQIDSDLFPLFGYKMGDQIHNQVFTKNDFKTVYDGLSAAKKEGRSVMTKTTLTTVKNEWWGIPAGHTVEILWVYNETVPEWQNKLQAPVLNEICLGPKGEFPDFPLYKLIFENGFTKGISLTTAQVNLLYQLSAWNVYSNKDAFDFMKKK